MLPVRQISLREPDKKALAYLPWFIVTQSFNAMRLVVLGLFLLPLVSGLQSHHFDHNVDVKHPESGEHVKLRSKGRLSEAIDLDRVQGIKVHLYI